MVTINNSKQYSQTVLDWINSIRCYSCYNMIEHITFSYFWFARQIHHKVHRCQPWHKPIACLQNLYHWVLSPLQCLPCTIGNKLLQCVICGIRLILQCISYILPLLTSKKKDKNTTFQEWFPIVLRQRLRSKLIKNSNGFLCVGLRTSCTNHVRNNGWSGSLFYDENWINSQFLAKSTKLNHTRFTLLRYQK